MIACHLALMLLEVSLIKVTSTFLSLTISPSRHIIFIHICITILFFSNLLIWRYTYRICKHHALDIILMPTGNWFLTSVTAVFQPSKLLNKVTRRSYLVWIVIPRKQWIGLPAVLSAPRGARCFERVFWIHGEQWWRYERVSTPSWVHGRLSQRKSWVGPFFLMCLRRSTTYSIYR